MKYKLLTISILSGILLTSQDAAAAKYKVTEITPLEDYRQHFAMDIGDNGQLLGVVRDSFNYPFYLEQYLRDLTVSNVSCNVSDEELSTGVFDANSSACIKAALAAQNRVTNPLFQKVGDNKSFINNAGSAELINLVDEFDSEINSLTKSNVEHLRAINSEGIAVGTVSAPFTTSMYLQTGNNASTTEVKVWQQEYSSRAVIYINGEVRLIDPEFTTYGGESDATDISNTGYVSGQTSMSMSQSTIDAIERDCNGNLVPKEACVWQKNQIGRVYESRPIIWKLDDAGNIESKQIYNLAFTPTADQTDNYFALSTAVNDAGVAVGYGNVFTSNNRFPTYPLIYQNGETKTFADQNEYDRGFATDINNSNVIVGTIQKFVNRVYTGEFFVYDMAADKFTTPRTFYVGAESSATSINNSGKVVGDAEYEITTDTRRRKHGFLYDTVTEEFFDLNDLTECGSIYEIVETQAINNSDQIAATALKTVDKRDALGKVVNDANGNPEKTQVALAVILDPIAGDIDDCTQIENPPTERKGASTSFFLSLGLFGLALFRRRFF